MSNTVQDLAEESREGQSDVDRDDPNLILTDQPHGSSTNLLQTLENAQLIPIGFLHPNPYQLRSTPIDGDIDDLAASIQEVGVLEPLLATRKGRKRYILIAGHRRLEAAKRAELTHVPCILLNLTNDQFLYYSLIENLQRSDLSPFEEATAIKQLIELTGATYRETAKKLGKSAGYISERLSLLEIPQDLKEAVASGNISLKKAIELAKIPIERLRRKLMERAAVGDLEEFKQMIQDEIARRKAGRKRYLRWDLVPELREFARNHDAVHIFKNRISLRYDSPLGLRRLLNELMTLLEQYDEEERSDLQSLSS